MKRFNLIHQSHWGEPVQFAVRKGSLGEAFRGKFCCWWDIPDGWRIVAGDFASEDREDAWNSHPAVIHLHHPVKEQALPLALLLTPDHAHKRFTAQHLSMLDAAFGVTAADTLQTLNAKVAAIHPGCAIYPIQKPTRLWLY